MKLSEILSQKLQDVETQEISDGKMTELEEMIAGCGCGSNSKSGTCNGSCGTSQVPWGP